MPEFAPVRFELHILKSKKLELTKTEMNRLARDWAAGRALPRGVKIKAVAWEHGRRRTIGTPAKIREYRERFAGLLQAGKMDVRKASREN